MVMGPPWVSNEDDLLTGQGAARNGGRWIRRGTRAVYASPDMAAFLLCYRGLLSALMDNGGNGTERGHERNGGKS